MTSLWAYLTLTAMVALERLFELWLSRRNRRLAMARGGVEVGQPHYRVMVMFHVAFLLACIAEGLARLGPAPALVAWLSFGFLIAAEALRYSAILALGARWNTRIIVIPGAAPVRSGPYRYLRHPNYLAVAMEIAALPMVHGCWITALVFSLGNAMLMAVRIPAEERALDAAWRDAFAGARRF